MAVLEDGTPLTRQPSSSPDGRWGSDTQNFPNRAPGALRSGQVLCHHDEAPGVQHTPQHRHRSHFLRRYVYPKPAHAQRTLNLNRVVHFTTRPCIYFSCDNSFTHSKMALLTLLKKTAFSILKTLLSHRRIWRKRKGGVRRKPGPLVFPPSQLQRLLPNQYQTTFPVDFEVSLYDFTVLLLKSLGYKDNAYAFCF